MGFIAAAGPQNPVALGASMLGHGGANLWLQASLV